MLKSIWRGLIEQLAPVVCVACDGLLGPDQSAFCAACEPLTERVLACAEPDLIAVYHYGGPVADAVWRMKYEGRSEVARALGPALAASALRWAGSIDAVTAVPLTPSKLRSRGYNQAALLAQRLARVLDLPFRPGWLARVRAGPRQVGQGRALRLSSIHGAFQASARALGKRVLVVDDVRTTGATLGEARRALESAGARQVLGLVLALADARSEDA